MTIELLKQEDEAKWDAFVNKHPDATFYHQIGYKKVVEKTFGHKAYYLAAKDKRGQITGVLPLFLLQSRIFKNTLLSLPFCNYGGILSQNEEAKKALLKAARKILALKKCRYLEFRYLSPQKISPNTRLDKVTMIINLPKKEEELWQSFGGKIRTHIRQGQKVNLIFKWGGQELIDDFYLPFSENMRLLGSPALPKKYFENLARFFPRQTKIAIVYYQEKPLAAAFLNFYQDRMEVPYSGALWQKYERFYPNLFLHWEIMKMAIKSKIKIYDFGRSSKDSSGYTFKSRWHAQPIQLFYQQYFPSAKKRNIVVHSPKNLSYSFLTKIWRFLPRPIANFFGPRIIRNIPY